jgi:hypothetical protein
MPHQITISGVSGTSPYDVYVCDVTNTYCFLISGGTTIPPSFTFEPVYPLNNVDSLLVKLIDSNNCEIFNYYEC